MKRELKVESLKDSYELRVTGYEVRQRRHENQMGGGYVGRQYCSASPEAEAVGLYLCPLKQA